MSDAAAAVALSRDAGAPCVSCGAVVTGLYCATCGEKGAGARDLSLRAFLSEAAASVLNFDSRGYRTFRELVGRPGALTASYVAGRRRQYLSPLQTFLIANIIFFIAAAWLPVVTFDAPLNAHLQSDEYGSLARSMVRDRNMASDSVAYDDFRSRFDYASTQQAKSLVILFVPLFALALALMRALKREPAGVHIAFALHHLAFSLLLFVLASAIIAVLRPVTGGFPSGNSPWIPASILLPLVAWLTLAFRRVYESSMPIAVLQAFVFGLLFVPLLVVFRFIVFFTVLWTV